jgi:hypothetical protein
MASLSLASLAVISSMMLSLSAYVFFSRREGTFINLLTPIYLVQIPANYLLQIVYIYLFGTEYSPYAYLYVYGSLAVANWAFVLAYTRRGRQPSPPPHAYGYDNFARISLVCLGLAYAIYAPVLLEFRDFLLDPRQIYQLTRSGYGHETFVSSTLAYSAIIFIFFAKRSWVVKGSLIAAACGLLVLHGSKGQVLNVFLLFLLFQVYVRGQRIAFFPALLRSLVLAGILIGLFAATLPLGGGPVEAVGEISQYSDYTRNAMLVIDSHVPLQFGRLTMEANIYGLIPRVLMPSKPKNFGAFYLVEEFYPEWFDADTGDPDFGIGVPYADFGMLTIIFLVLFAVVNGWLARIFVSRLRLTQHPSDFLVVVFFAGVSLIPVGGSIWLFPETVVLAMIARYVSRIGADRVMRLKSLEQLVRLGA